MLDQYLAVANLPDDPKQPLFTSTRGRSRKLGLDPLSRKDAWAMLKRRLRDAGVSSIYCNHSLRAAGITNFLENGGSLEAAQRMAGPRRLQNYQAVRSPRSTHPRCRRRTSQVLRVTQELQCLNLKPRHYQNSYSQYPLRHIGSTLAQHLSFVWVGYH
jgi:hypothetical protein